MRASACLFVIMFGLSAMSAIAQLTEAAGDMSAIKRVIEREVDALNRDHNLNEYLSCFLESDRVQVGPSNNKMTKGYAAIKANAQQVINNYNGKPNLNTWSFADWEIQINGTTAFASCVQTTKTSQGTLIDVFKSDYLVKVKGEWKIVDHRYFHAPERKG